MRSLSHLLRPCQPRYYRVKGTNINFAKRKYFRREKSINIHSKAYTGEQNYNSWFTPKRFRAYGLYIQNIRNVHRGSAPITGYLRKGLTEKFTADSHWVYYVWRNSLKQYEYQSAASLNSLNQYTFDLLPSYFRTEIMKIEVPDINSMVIPRPIDARFIYNYQENVFLPMDERWRRNLMLKIVNPPKYQKEEGHDAMDLDLYKEND